MAKTLFFWVLSLGLIVGSGGSSAWSTSFAHKTFEQAVSEAPLIVRGKVQDIQSHAEASDPALYTYIQIQVSESMKGDVSDRTVWVRQQGGERDGAQLKVFGAATFNVGEDTVVFLESNRNGDRSMNLRGMEMGKYQVVKEADGSETLTGGRITGDPDLHEPREARKRWTLQDVRALIKNGTPASSAQPKSVAASSEPLAVAKPTASGSDTAKSPESETETSHLGLFLTLGLLAIAAILWVLLRRRS
jgi:hypothetical protein